MGTARVGDNEPMLLAMLLLGWFVVSIPVALVLGAVLKLRLAEEVTVGAGLGRAAPAIDRRCA